ncbi:MAG: flagellar hook capping FlgD N-terminal domain-containing protein [Desulfosalsimonadaceae bacterium]
MSGIEALQGFTQQTESKSGKSAEALGKNDFLNLLVAQLENQDPLDPSDPTEFTSQLAQYSSLEQLQNINSSMEALDSVKGEFERMSALSLIGKNVVAESNTFRFEGDPVELGYRFSGSMEEASLYVKDESGRVVDEIRIDSPAAGEHFLSWAGAEDGAADLPEGSYTLEVAGKKADGSEVSGVPLVGSRVTGADFQGSEASLLTPGGSISVSDVSRVNNPTSTEGN